MASASDFLLIGGLVIGGYYLLQSGMLNQILGGLGGPPPPGGIMQYPTEAEEGGEEEGGEEGGEEEEEGGGKRGGKKRKSRRRDREQEQQQFPTPQPYPQGGPDEQFYQGQPQQYPPQYPQQQPRGIPPPPGSISSLYPLPVSPSQTPPYVSQTVGTYSPYSPYNQFNVYQQYKVPGIQSLAQAPDDNVNFSDINISQPGCFQCKRICQYSPYGFQCRSCRSPCKHVTHSFTNPQTGWDIRPVGILPATYGQQIGQQYPQQTQQYSPYQTQNYQYQTQTYLGQLADLAGQAADWLTGGAVFADMDDYHQGKRFDCHNKLKRRIKGKSNLQPFVTREDYYYDKNDVPIAIG